MRVWLFYSELIYIGKSDNAFASPYFIFLRLKQKQFERIFTIRENIPYLWGYLLCITVVFRILYLFILSTTFAVGCKWYGGGWSCASPGNPSSRLKRFDDSCTQAAIVLAVYFKQLAWKKSTPYRLLFAAFMNWEYSLISLYSIWILPELSIMLISKLLEFH